MTKGPMSEIELREAIPIETRTLVEMNAQLTQLHERAEAAEKELAELKAKVQPLVDCLKDIASLDDLEPLWISVDARAILQQWDNSQNQSTNARATGSTPSQTPPPHQDSGPES